MTSYCKKQLLPAHCHCQGIKEEVTKLAEIEFLIGVAPLFNTYLRSFQWEGPLVHCLLEEMTILFYPLVGQLIKEDLLTLNVSDAGMQMKLENIDYGTKTK